MTPQKCAEGTHRNTDGMHRFAWTGGNPGAPHPSVSYSRQTTALLCADMRSMLMVLLHSKVLSDWFGGALRRQVSLGQHERRRRVLLFFLRPNLHRVLQVLVPGRRQVRLQLDSWRTLPVLLLLDRRDGGGKDEDDRTRIVQVGTV